MKAWKAFGATVSTVLIGSLPWLHPAARRLPGTVHKHQIAQVGRRLAALTARALRR